MTVVTGASEEVSVPDVGEASPVEERDVFSVVEVSEWGGWEAVVELEGGSEVVVLSWVVDEEGGFEEVVSGGCEVVSGGGVDV